MSETQLTAEEIEAALNGEGPDVYVCPECGKTFSSENSLNGHLSAHRGRQAASRKAAGGAQASRERPKPKGSPSAGLDGSARAIINKAVANTQAVGALLTAIPFTTHTGLTIAGLVDPQTKRVIVRSRAVVAGEILSAQVAAASSQDELQRAAQILELLRRYNTIFEYSALGDVAGSLLLAAAVDARVIPPDFRIKLGVLELPIVEAAIGDVVHELDRQGFYEPGPGEQPPPEPPAQNTEPGAETIAGDVTQT